MKEINITKKYFIASLGVLLLILFTIPLQSEAFSFTPSGIVGTLGGKLLAKCPLAKPEYNSSGGGGLGGAVNLGKNIKKTLTGGVSGAVSGVLGGGGGSSDAVPILSSDVEREAAQRYVQKEIGNCRSFIGKPVPLGSWDSLYTSIAKSLLRDITTDLVGWINGGANGSPKFVQDPAQFFGNLADETSGHLIDQIGASGLCEPIKISVVTSLSAKYGGAGGPGTDGNNSPTCTFTGARNNLQNFLQDFKEGGWQGWFSMTQNDNNNADGAYLQTTAIIDNQIAQKLGIESQQLDWGKGFLSMKETVCIVKDADGNCIKTEDNITTPGTYIENYLAQNSGTWVRQLELADEFDEVLNASLGALTNAVIKKGISFSGDLLKNAFNDAPDPSTLASQDEEDVQCLSNITEGPVGTIVSWGADSTLKSGLFGGPVIYTWSGDEIPVGKEGSTISVQYNLEGTKQARVTAIGKDSSGKSQTLRASCDNSVEIGSTSTSTPSTTPPASQALSVSCSPESSRTQTNTVVRWIAKVTGGSGSLASVQWNGSDSNNGEWNQYSDQITPIEGAEGGNFIYKPRQYSTEGMKGASVLVQDSNPDVDPSQTICDSFLQVTNTPAPGPADLPPTT